jgi:hypothetical protein
VVVGTGAERDRLRDEVRRQVAFYASTPSYRTVLAAHGWEDRGEELSRLASRGRWDRMAEPVSDEMLAECTVEGDTLSDVARAIKARYDGLLDRVAPYLPYTPGQRDDEWREACAVVSG